MYIYIIYIFIKVTKKKGGIQIEQGDMIAIPEFIT